MDGNIKWIFLSTMHTKKRSLFLKTWNKSLRNKLFFFAFFSLQIEQIYKINCTKKKSPQLSSAAYEWKFMVEGGSAWFCSPFALLKIF